MGYNHQYPKYSQEHIEWVGANRFNYSKSELVKEFNKHFNTTINGNMINGILKRHNGNTKTKNSLDVFNPNVEQIEWIKKNFANYKRYNDLVRDFNKTFKTNITKNQMPNYTHKLNLRYDVKEAIRFTTQITRTSPIGSEYITSKGYIMVKVNNLTSKESKNQFKDNWKLKHYIVWEKVYGEIPPNHKIIFLDGNPQNCDISNLRCVSNYVFNHTSSNGHREHFYGYGKVTDAMITLLQTQELALNKIKGNG